MADLGGAFMGPVLQNQEWVQKQSLFPVELEQKKQSTRYTAALANHLEVEDAETQKAAQMMAQSMGSGDFGALDGNMSSQLYRMANVYARAGLVTKAGDLLGKASSAAAHEATARSAEARTGLAKIQMSEKVTGQLVKMADGINSQADWDAANKTIEQMTGQKSPFSDVPYDPQLITALKNQAMTEYQKRLADVRDKALKLSAENIASEMAHRTTTEGLERQRLQLSKDREARISKTGGKDIGSPSSVEVAAAGRLIGDALEGDEKDSAGFSIASEAKVLRRRNPGMSSDDALRQAYLNAQKSGDFVPKESSWKPFGGSPAKFTTPQPLPRAKKDLKVGGHYTQSDGSVGEWTKDDGWKRVGQGAPAPRGSGGNDEEDDDADDGAE